MWAIIRGVKDGKNEVKLFVKTKVFRFVPRKITSRAVAVEQGHDSAGGSLVNRAAGVSVSWRFVLPQRHKTK